MTSFPNIPDILNIPKTPDEFIVQVFFGALGLIKYFIKILPENPILSSILFFMIIIPFVLKILLLRLSKKKKDCNKQKTIITKKNIIENKLYFDEEKSILHLQGFKIPIAIQDRITNAHKILNHIFITNKDNLNDEFYYAEIAEKEFGEPDYKRNWRMFHTACQEIQEKIRRTTRNEIEDFLDFNSSKRGRVKINPKYLPKQAEKPEEFLGKS